MFTMLSSRHKQQSIKEECYGGEETIFQYDEYRRTQGYRRVEKTRSAYMLIYERIVPQIVPSGKPAQDAEQRHDEEEEDEHVEGEPTEHTPDVSETESNPSPDAACSTGSSVYIYFISCA